MSYEAARAANSREEWDRLWGDPQQAEWREETLRPVYDRIAQLVPKGAKVYDLGGGPGTLAKRLHFDNDCDVEVWDHSEIAGALCEVPFKLVDLEGDDLPKFKRQDHRWPGGYTVVSTECLEHLTPFGRKRILEAVAKDHRDLWCQIAMTEDEPCILGAAAIISVPNDRLGPDEEAQHTRSWTAKEFLDELREHFGDDCRVEVLGPFLLGVCGTWAKKNFRLSVCTPARDEAKDIERTLASFRGVADQLVVGVDYRTTDNTREVAAKYADLVFDIDNPLGPPEDEAKSIHFAHVRNLCIEKCDGDWIFMTEAHESLLEGADELLQLGQLPDAAKVAFVKRTGQGQQWAFPWLFRNDPKIRFIRPVHNALDFPEKYMLIKLPGIATLHERHADNATARAAQRKTQNRTQLLDDWTSRGSENSLAYLGSEMASYDKDKAIQRLKEYLAVNRSNGAQRYHVRLQVSKLLAQQGDVDEARAVLINAAADDWSRVDHFFYLGDLALMREVYDEALQFYRYAATRLGDPPFCVWWVDTSIYGYLTAQRLTECYAALGRLDEALDWAAKVVDLMPEGTPVKVLDEAHENVRRITEAIEKDERTNQG